MTGYALCGSFCTAAASLAALSRLAESGEELIPIVSERFAATDTRFGRGAELVAEAERLCGRSAVRTVEEAELFGAMKPLDRLVVAPCTGNTLAKLANGVTDGCVPMAVKAHWRNDRPLLIALATNDGLSQSLANLARLLARRGVYFVPMRQDDPRGKPHSLVASFERLPEAFAAMGRGEQLRPLFL